MKAAKILTAATIAAGLLTSTLPVVAQAQAIARNTIGLEGFTVSAGLHPNTSDGESAPGFITISFVNRGDVAATEVRFVVESSLQPDAVIDDVGRFSPGVSIRHRFQNDAISSDAKVHVAEVRYADGSTWTEDQGPLPEHRQASGS
jgi:hypothetical protein